VLIDLAPKILTSLDQFEDENSETTTSLSSEQREWLQKAMVYLRAIFKNPEVVNFDETFYKNVCMVYSELLNIDYLFLNKDTINRAAGKLN